MHLKGILDEDFINYKVPSMHIATSRCSFKCDKETGKQLCQNSPLAAQKTITIKNDDIIKRYLSNDITHAIVFAGLEPMDSFEEILSFIKCLRNKYKCEDDVVIYSGYREGEIEDKLVKLAEYKNIVIKFGRYLSNHDRHFDSVLGVYLASPNQYAVRLYYKGDLYGESSIDATD